MTPDDLLDLISARLTRTHSLSRRQWRRVLGPVRRYPRTTHPSCNWSIEPAGTAREIDAAQAVLDDVRAEHPFVDS